tara:strand:- start:3555 stop:4115 length:561 start_codon:yes stop_codon:yes gene_type:complete
MELEYRLNKRRRYEGFIQEKIEDNITFKRMPLAKQKEYKKKVRTSNMEYNFLQYSLIIRTWAKRNYDLTARQLDILFYIYPIHIFTSGQFTKSLKEMGISDYSVLKKLKNGGWVSLWSTNGRKRYYVLSHKGNELMKKIHRMCMLEEEIPMSARRNVIVRSKEKKDQNLVDLFKKFNDKVREKNNK